MKLTRDQFRMIRPLQWCLRSYGKHIYNTPIDQTQTQLFWLDFMQFIFAPRFKQQQGIQKLANFDQTQPVLLTDDLIITLPTELETVFYYADNKTLPIIFQVPCPQFVVMLLAFIILLFILFVDYKYNVRGQFTQII